MSPFILVPCTKHWRVPLHGHYSFVIFAIWSVPITAVRWSSRKKYVHGLTDILFMAYHTSRYISTMIDACKALVQLEKCSFSHYLWNTSCIDSFLLSMAATKCTDIWRSWHAPFICFLSCKVLVISKIMIIVAGLCTYSLLSDLCFYSFCLS